MVRLVAHDAKSRRRIRIRKPSTRERDVLRTPNLIGTLTSDSFIVEVFYLRLLGRRKGERIPGRERS